MSARIPFEALKLGDVRYHPLTRTLSEADNLFASVLIMSSEPLQLDAEFAARSSPSGERLFNSVFTLGLMIGISGHDFAYVGLDLGFEEARFPHPARIGDTLRIESEVISLNAARRTALLRHRALTQRGAMVGIASRYATFA